MRGGKMEKRDRRTVEVSMYVGAENNGKSNSGN